MKVGCIPAPGATIWGRGAECNYLFSSVGKGLLSDAGGPRFDSQTGWVWGRSAPSLWRDKHPAIKGLQPPEHHAGKFRQDQKDSSETKTTK